MEPHKFENKIMYPLICRFCEQPPDANIHKMDDMKSFLDEYEDIPEKWFTCSVKILAQNEEHVRDLLHTNASGLPDALEITEDYVGQEDNDE